MASIGASVIAAPSSRRRVIGAILTVSGSDPFAPRPFRFLDHDRSWPRRNAEPSGPDAQSLASYTARNSVRSPRRSEQEGRFAAASDDFGVAAAGDGACRISQRDSLTCLLRVGLR